MKKIIFCLWAILVCSNLSLSQNATVYEIETLPKPEKLIAQFATKDVYRFLDVNIEKSSVCFDSLVCFGEHPFLTGILTAYKEHRPFVISPDILWVLISQGFARHISNNAELYRKDIVGFNNKKDLVISTDAIELGNVKSDWESLFPQFINQINDYTGKKLSDVLTANFTTTTATTKIVSEITVMETVKEYFNYKVIMIGCGIPRITIEGTVKDWEKILAKTQYLSKYNLTWWTNELEPILQEIIKAKKGHFNKAFWMNMVKAHTEKKYGSPTTIDGWIIKFFPYTKEGKKTDLKPITQINSLASELVKVPFTLIDEKNNKSYKMEFWGGFIGLTQDKNDYTLHPQIAWLINNKNSFDAKNSRFSFMKEIDDLSINNITNEIPQDVYSLHKIQHLHLSFLNNIFIPNKLSQITIETLELTGLITTEEEGKIIKLFPNTKIKINGKEKNTLTN